MLINFFRFLLGWVRFRVEGEFPERFLNQLAHNGVSVWGLRRSRDGIEASTTVRSYLKFHKFKAKNKIKTRVIDRKGLPFMAKKYRLRIGFAVGMVFFVISLFILSTFVWNIEVVGNNELSDREILSALEELGLEEGVKRSSIDQELLRTRLALKIDKIAWASVNIEGVKVTVNISESKPPKKEPQEPCNLVADFDGVVTAIEVTDGTVKTAVGKTVQKGELLVSGITEFKDGTYSFGPSEGKIIALTDRELSLFVPFTQTLVVHNGEVEKHRVLSVFGLNIPLYLGSVDGTYETESELKRYEKNGMYLPIELTETVFYKTEAKTITLSTADAKKQAEENLSELEKKALENVEILEKTVEIRESSKGITIIANYKCKQNIVKTDLLLILEEK